MYTLPFFLLPKIEQGKVSQLYSLTAFSPLCMLYQIVFGILFHTYNTWSKIDSRFAFSYPQILYRIQANVRKISLMYNH